MAKFGPTSRVAQFIARTIPKRGSGPYSSLFAVCVADVLQRLDELALANPRVSINIYADTLRAFYDGQLLFYLLPAQTHLRIMVGKHWSSPSSKYLLRCIADAAKSGKNFQTTKHNGPDRQWLANHADLIKFCAFLGKLDRPSAVQSAADKSHPRHFPSELRAAALEHFMASGSRCPGFGRNSHRLDLQKDRIEYDHILPHSRGGASSEWNIQVLCSECNRRKHAKAA